MKKILLALAFATSAFYSQAQAPFALSGTSYTPNFDRNFPAGDYHLDGELTVW